MQVAGINLHLQIKEGLRLWYSPSTVNLSSHLKNLCTCGAEWMVLAASITLERPQLSSDA